MAISWHGKWATGACQLEPEECSKKRIALARGSYGRQQREGCSNSKRFISVRKKA